MTLTIVQEDSSTTSTSTSRGSGIIDRLTDMADQLNDNIVWNWLSSRDPDSRYITYKKEKSIRWRIQSFFGKEETKQKYSVEQFFSLIKRGKSELTEELANKYSEGIKKQIEQAVVLWQKSTISLLEKQLAWLQKEVQILNELWLNKYVFEKDIAELESVWIQWRTVQRKTIEQYVGIIPQECVDSIVEAKKANLFDEIVVIYTRKREKQMNLDKSRKTTPASQNTRVDPICFGKVNETGRLFFITDRMDDECDLTMDKLQKEIDVWYLVSNTPSNE